MPPTSSSASSGSSTPRSTLHPPFAERVKNLAKRVEFYWWLGHTTFLVSAINYMFSGSASVYGLAYAACLISYVIVLFISHGKPRLNLQYLQSLYKDESAMYAVMAFYWWVSSPVMISLLPYAMYSHYHVLSFFVSAIIPVIAPGVPGELNAQPHLSAAAQVSTLIMKYVNGQCQAIIHQVPNVEVYIVGPVILLMAITFQWSPFVLFTYAAFLRFRYQENATVRVAFGQARAHFDSKLLPPPHGNANQQIPPWLSNAYVTIREALIKFGSAGRPAPASA
ncbi:hypothetical protein GQ42DRAFT_131642, partial [Ramicandelaber brevisporus]